MLDNFVASPLSQLLKKYVYYYKNPDEFFMDRFQYYSIYAAHSCNQPQKKIEKDGFS